MNRIQDIKLSIVKMKESSGNIQFFCRAYRLDTSNMSKLEKLTHGLDIACYQTKQLDIKECMSRAWFTISYSARFYGIPMEEINLVKFTEEEELFIKQQLRVY